MASTGLRVTGGTLGGRRLRTPPDGLRPTSDRVREALFARLGDLGGTAVLDLYAGTGALGVEAISRGARFAVFVEESARTLSVLRKNIETLGLEDVSRVVRGDAIQALGRLARRGERYDLVFVDPPYASDAVPGALQSLVASGVLLKGATVVVEHHRRHPVPRVEGLGARDERSYGDTVITRLVAAAEEDENSAEERGGPLET